MRRHSVQVGPFGFSHHCARQVPAANWNLLSWWLWQWHLLGQCSFNPSRPTQMSATSIHHSMWGSEPLTVWTTCQQRSGSEATAPHSSSNSDRLCLWWSCSLLSPAPLPCWVLVPGAHSSTEAQPWFSSWKTVGAEITEGRHLRKGPYLDA